jgi:hypothetical protein
MTGFRHHSSNDLVGQVGVDVGAELDPAGGGGGGEFDPELPGGMEHGVGGRVGHAREQCDLDAVAERSVPGRRLQQRVGERRSEACTSIVVE